eukprot:XP_010656729.2 PREDICTED: uncharacterized protein LOC104880753 [Vitis vinifera]
MVTFFGTRRVSFSVLARILPDLGTGPDSTFFCIHTNLAQSIIDLLYHFFPLTIDELNPKTSLINGEAPFFIECGNFKDALSTIFGDSENAKGNVGFGAEQVILVRNDSAKEEISKYVGNKALVLTILECKGLEFRDVLLCNFFGSCPFKHHWRVLYQFVKKINLVDSKSLISFPSFDEAKHNVLCSELKQLYVAITRTRQRLWICDNIDEVSKPMLEYWEKLSLIEFRCLHDLVAQGMQVASRPDEWRSQGFKLFYEHNYEMARMCFEKAGDTYNEKFVRAANLQALANSISSSSPQIAKNYLNEAADLFEGIGKAEYAAKCFFEMKNYERAGRIYMEKCGDPKSAAEAYAKGNFLSECLALCIKGRLFYMGLQFIQQWKQNSKGAIKESREIHRIEQNLLEGCARHHHELKDLTGMMKYVRAFHSFELIRTFLRDLRCLDELLLIEKEKENFVEAANIAKCIGDISLEVEMLVEAGCLEDSSKAILQYVLVNSLWQPGSKGWPLKHFIRKKELVNKAKVNAERVSKQFYGFICTEVDILSHKRSTLFELNEYFRSSQNNGSVRGEILSARKIIDAHLHLISTLEDRGKSDLYTYLTTHSEERISSNQFSIETLVHFWKFWNFWKDEIVNILEYLGGAIKKYVDYKEFCLNYLGVLKQPNKRTPLYLVLNPEADWVRKTDDRFLQRNGKLVFIDASQFASAARSYWCSELLSVGVKILENLEALYQFCTRNSFPVFCQSIPLIYILDATNFLMKTGSLHSWHPHAKTLQMFLEKSSERFFGYIYPLDWRKSSTEDMVSLRENKLAWNLLREVILKTMSLKGNLTYGQIGRAVIIMLGLSKLTDKSAESFNKDSPWKEFIKRLCVIKRSELSSNSSAAAQQELSLILKLHGALDDTYHAKRRKEIDFMSPVCFLYLVEHLLFLVSYCQGYVFTTKALVVEWLIFPQGKTTLSASSLTDVGASEKTEILGDTYCFMASIVHELLCDVEGTVEWLEKSNTNSMDYPVLVLRLVVIMCLICVNSGKHFDLLFDLLDRNCIISHLPKPFYDAFLGRQKRSFVEVLAEALKQIESVLVIVSWGNNHFHFSPDAILVDDVVNQNKEGILRVLFTKNVSSRGQQSLIYSDCGKGSEPDSSNSSTADLNMKVRNEAEGNDLQENYEHFCEIFNALKPLENAKDSGMEKFNLNNPRVQVLVEKSINLIVAVMTQYFQMIPCDSEDENMAREPNRVHCEDGNLLWHANRMVDGFKQLPYLLNGSPFYANIMVDGLKQLSYLLNWSPVFSGKNLEKNMSNFQLLLKQLQSGKARVEPFMRQICLKNAAAAGSRITEDNNSG